MPQSATRPTFFTSFLSAFRAGQKFAPLQSKSQPSSASASGTTASGSLSQSLSITTRASPPSNSWDTVSSALAIPSSSSASAHMQTTSPAAAHPLPVRQPSPGPTSPRSIPFARSPSPAMHDSISSFSRQQRSRTPSETRMGATAAAATTRRSSELAGAGNSGGDGFKTGFAARTEDPLSAQNWYVGGRTATGEERFYKLGMVKRYNSQDRLSLDRLSI